MDALPGVALGRLMVGPVLSGKLKIGGKAWRLVREVKKIMDPDGILTPGHLVQPE